MFLFQLDICLFVDLQIFHTNSKGFIDIFYCRISFAFPFDCGWYSFFALQGYFHSIIHQKSNQLIRNYWKCNSIRANRFIYVQRSVNYILHSFIEMIFTTDNIVETVSGRDSFWLVCAFNSTNAIPLGSVQITCIINIPLQTLKYLSNIHPSMHWQWTLNISEKSKEIYSTINTRNEKNLTKKKKIDKNRSNSNLKFEM